MIRSKAVAASALGALLMTVLTGCPGFIANVVGSSESIQQAIDSAQVGDTVKVMGTHHEDVTIETDSLSLVGQDGAVLDGDLVVKSDDVTVENLTVTGMLETPTGSFANLTLSDVEIYDVVLDENLDCAAVVNAGEGLQATVESPVIEDGDTVCVAPGVDASGLTIAKDLTFIRLGTGTFAPDELPEAAFSLSSADPAVGDSVTFDASASVDPAGLSVDGQGIVSYDWAFGDGNTASGQQVDHPFAESGTFEVSLTVTDDDGATDTATKSVNPEAKIYWTDGSGDGHDGIIRRANLDGSGVEDLVTDLDGPAGIAVDVAGGKMYWASDGAGIIRRANLDGSGVEDLATELTSPRGIALDPEGGKVYWTDPDVSRVQRVNLDGSGPVETIDTLGPDGPGIVLDPESNALYWTDSDGSIWRSTLNGDDFEEVVSLDGSSFAFSIALDPANDDVYWTDGGSNEVKRANLDGSGVEVIHDAPDPWGIGLDPDRGKVYWIQNEADASAVIRRANLGESGVETILDHIQGLDSPFGIAIGD